MMDIAQVDGTSEFQPEDIYPPNNCGSTVDLNEAPFKMKEEHLARMRALSRTGNSCFPSFPSFLLNTFLEVKD